MEHAADIAHIQGLTALAVGIIFGIICALKRSTWIDTIVTLFANIGVTMPSFWVGIILIFLLSVELGWLPVGGFTSPFVNLAKSMKQIIMPVLCLALFPVASLTRLTRSSMLEVLSEDYVRTARAKGLAENRILYKHVFRNAMLIVISGFPMALMSIFLTGSVLIETIFSLNGLGLLSFESVLNRDYPVVFATLYIFSLIGVVVNLISDLTYTWIDPRIDFETREV